MENLIDLVKPLYTECFTVNQTTDVAAVMGRLLADGLQSFGSVDAKSKAQLIGQIQYFWKLVPDLKWEPQQMLQDGHQVIVRSIASGTPKGDFMGVPTDGTRSFKIMTIDIHTIEGQQIRAIHHVEDWGTAFRQLKA